MSLFCDYCNVAFPSGCTCGKVGLYKLWAPEIDKVNKLKKENAKLRECVEFYADRNSWYISRILSCTRIDNPHKSDLEKFKDDGKDYFYGGKLARETLKELEGGE